MLCCVLPVLVMVCIRVASRAWGVLLGGSTSAPARRPPVATRTVTDTVTVGVAA